MQEQKKQRITMALADLMKPLTAVHLLTWIGSIISLIFALTKVGDVKDAQKFSLNQVERVANEVKLTKVTEGMFYQMNTLWLLAISEILVILITTTHVFRRAFECLPDLYKGSTGMVASFINIAAFSISHFLAMLTFYLVAGYDDTLGAIAIFVLIVGMEAIVHMISNPATSLTPGSRVSLMLFSGVGLLVVSIFIGIALQVQEDDGLKGGVTAFILLVVCQALKFVNEILHGEPLGLKNWSIATDSRVAQRVLDVMIKTLLVWYVNLSLYEKAGGLGDSTVSDLESQKTIVLVIALVWGGLYFLYSLLTMVAPLPKLIDGDAKKEDFPSGSLEEKSRMLQVA
jgi:hypothetical protein